MYWPLLPLTTTLSPQECDYAENVPGHVPIDADYDDDDDADVHHGNDAAYRHADGDSYC